jgi:hypothetical protein
VTVGLNRLVEVAVIIREDECLATPETGGDAG